MPATSFLISKVAMAFGDQVSRHELTDRRKLLLSEPGRAPGRLGDRLLREEAGGGDHAEARMGELLLLHERELSRVLGREVERVESEVAGDVARLERRLSLQLLAVELAERNVDAVRLRRRNATAHDHPEPHGQLRDLVDRRTAVAGEERVELLLHEEASGRKHADATVGQLSLAVPVHLELGLALEEVSRVKVELGATQGVEVTREAVREGGSRSSLLGGREATEVECSGREGSDGKHCAGCV